MSQLNLQTGNPQGIRDQVGLGPITSTSPSKKVVDEDVFARSSVDDLYFFSMDKAEQELEEIREEVAETGASVGDVEFVPEAAYNETLSLLKRLHHRMPMPNIMSLEGGIGLEWRPEGGIVTVSLYGDNHVTFVAILADEHEIAGTCPLSDPVFLSSFLATLPLLFRRKG